MKEDFTWNMKVDGLLVAEINVTAELEYDRECDCVDFIAIRISVLGTGDKTHIKVTGSDFSRIVADLEEDYAEDLAEILEEMRAGVDGYDREMARAT